MDPYLFYVLMGITVFVAFIVPFLPRDVMDRHLLAEPSRVGRIFRYVCFGILLLSLAGVVGAAYTGVGYDLVLVLGVIVVTMVFLAPMSLVVEAYAGRVRDLKLGFVAYCVLLLPFLASTGAEFSIYFLRTDVDPLTTPNYEIVESARDIDFRYHDRREEGAACPLDMIDRDDVVQPDGSVIPNSFFQYQANWFDMVLESATLGYWETFGCEISRVEADSRNLTVNAIRWIVTLSVEVIVVGLLLAIFRGPLAMILGLRRSG